jgi:hypothetical protein
MAHGQGKQPAQNQHGNSSHLLDIPALKFSSAYSMLPEARQNPSD